MKSSLFRAALACLAFALPATAAFAAAGDPIIGVPHRSRGRSDSIVIAHGVTDDKGQFTFGKIAPGKYLIVLDSKGLALALKKIDPKGLPATLTIIVTVQPVGDNKPSILVSSYQTSGSGGEIRPTKVTVPAAPRGTTDLGRTVFVGVTIKLDGDSKNAEIKRIGVVPSRMTPLPPSLALGRSSLETSHRLVSFASRTAPHPFALIRCAQKGRSPLGEPKASLEKEG